MQASVVVVRAINLERDLAVGRLEGVINEPMIAEEIALGEFVHQHLRLLQPEDLAEQVHEDILGLGAGSGALHGSESSLEQLDLWPDA